MPQSVLNSAFDTQRVIINATTSAACYRIIINLEI